MQKAGGLEAGLWGCGQRRPDTLGREGLVNYSLVVFLVSFTLVGDDTNPASLDVISCRSLTYVHIVVHRHLSVMTRKSGMPIPQHQLHLRL